MMKGMRRVLPKLFLFISFVVLVRTLLRATGPARRQLTIQFNKHLVNPFAMSMIGRRRTYYGVIHHVGRRSGNTYDTPVVVKITADGIIVPLPYGADTDWCRNVQAAGGCTLTFNGEAFTVTAPQVIPAAEAEPRVPAINARLWHLVGIKDYLLLKPIQDNSEVVGEPTAAAVMAT